MLPAARRTKIRKALGATGKALSAAASLNGRVKIQQPKIAVIVIATDPESTAETIRNVLSQQLHAIEVVVSHPVHVDGVPWVRSPDSPTDRRVSWLSSRGGNELGDVGDCLAGSTAPSVLVLRGGEQLQTAFLRTVIGELGRSNAQFLVGTVRGSKGASAAFGETAAKDDAAVNVEGLPQVFLDRAVGNKLFSRRFLAELTELAGDNPEIRTADLPDLAYGLAKSFELTSIPALRRAVPDNLRTLGRAVLCDPEFMNAVVASTEAVSKILKPALSGAVYSTWLTRQLGTNFFPFYEVVPRVDGAYWESLQRSVTGLAASGEIVWPEIRLHQRLLLANMLKGHRSDVETISISRSDYASSYVVKEADGALRAEPEYLKRIQAPEPMELLEFNPVDQVSVARLTHFSWLHDGTLEIQGHAYVKGLDPVAGMSQLNATLVDGEGAAVQSLAALPVTDHTIDWTANDNWTSYAASGFKLSINPAELFEAAKDDSSNRWNLVLALTVFGREFDQLETTRDMRGSGGFVPVGPMSNGTRMAIEFSPDTGLSVLRVAPRVQAASASFDHDMFLSLELHTSDPALAGTTSRLLAVSTTGRRTHAKEFSFSAEGSASVRLQLPKGPQGHRKYDASSWDLTLALPDGAQVPIALPGGSSTMESSNCSLQQFSIDQTGHGYLRTSSSRNLILADDVTLSDDESSLRIKGSWSFDSPDAPNLVLHSGKAVITPSHVELNHTSGSSGEYLATFPLVHDEWSLGPVYRESGAYSLRQVDTGVPPSSGHWIISTPRLQQTMPQRIHGNNIEVGVSRTPNSAALVIHLRPSLRADEIGRFNQQKLRADTGHGPIQDNLALIMCFGGKRATDSPRRLFEELQVQAPHVKVHWAVADASVPVPDGAVRTVIGSREWFEVLSTARLLINNNNFPFYFRKRPGQTYIQTWHGTPLKRLGNDVARTNFSLSYWNLMWREATYWDALLAQNDYAAHVLATCFGFNGPVIAQGYPRNDSLRSERSEQIRQETRARLGIPAGKTVILYAPTWRDDVRSASNNYELVTYLDFEQAQRELGDGYTILLRGHHNISGQRQTAENSFIVDVTEYPEVNDLYLAADMLVNDYSSVMFDFCVTRKPIVYLTPDIARYRDSTRGFYFDLESQAPGPLLSTSGQVIDAIGNIAEITERYSERYEAFVAKFAPHCDGHATERTMHELAKIPGFLSGRSK